MVKTNPIVRAIELSRATEAEEDEAYEILGKRWAQRLNHAVLGPQTVTLESLADTLEPAKLNLVEGDKLHGLSTGYQCLDKMTGGLVKGALIVMFGDTGHGKTQLAQNITLNLALKDIPTLFVGLEMTNVENTVRFLQMLGPKEDHFYSRLPILYPKSMDIDYKEVDGLVKTATSEGTKLIVIDHLHAMKLPGNGNRADAIEDVVYEMKRVARKYDVPIILISHINEDKGRTGMPGLKDLKGSSAIKQCADLAISIWRDMDPDIEAKDLNIQLQKRRNGSLKHRKAALGILDSTRLIETIDWTFQKT